MPSGNRIYDPADPENFDQDLPELKYGPPAPLADGGSSSTPSMSDGTANARIEKRAALACGPAYTGSAAPVGSAEIGCPVPGEEEAVQRLLEVVFTDENGERLKTIGDKQTIRLVVRSENMSGEELVLELDEKLGLPKVKGQVVKPDQHVRIPIGADEFYVEIDVVPTILIYTDGKLSKADLTTSGKVQFVYKDASATFHDLGEHDILLAQKWTKAFMSKTSAPKNAFYTKEDGKERWFGLDGKKKAPLVKVFSASNNFIYDVAPVKIHLHYNQGGRPYYNPEALAGLFGALAETGYTDVVSNGSVGADGTGAPSVSHRNGYNSDLKYLRKDKLKGRIDDLPPVMENGKPVVKKAMPILVSDPMLDVDRQNAFNDALAKFGYSGMLSHYYQVPKKPKKPAPAAAPGKPAKPPEMENRLLNHCSKDEHHKDHLHIQGFRPKYA